MRSDGIEVSEQDHVPLIISLLDVGQDLLEHGLGPAVRIGALSLGALLGDGNKCRISVHGGTG